MPPRTPRPAELIVLSARTRSALAQARQNLALYLEANPDVPLEDVAHTLALGRRAFDHRDAFTASSVADARRRIAASQDDPAAARIGRPAVGLLFPGSAEGYRAVASELHRNEPVYRAAVDRCLEAVADGGDRDRLRRICAGEAEMTSPARSDGPSPDAPALYWPRTVLCRTSRPRNRTPARIPRSIKRGTVARFWCRISVDREGSWLTTAATTTRSAGT